LGFGKSVLLGMAAALVSSGAVNRDLFLQPSISGEMFFIFAKVRRSWRTCARNLAIPKPLAESKK